MAKGTLKYTDEDEWDTQRTKPLRPLAHAQVRRYRIPILIGLIVFALVYWFALPITLATEESEDWSRYAYVQYVTDSHTMCNAFMVFEALKRLGSKADRVLLYPEEWSVDDDPSSRDSELLFRAEEMYDVKLKPTQLLGPDGPLEAGTLERPSGYETSITKLRLFEMDDYERILYFDNDVILQQHMDELFILPSTPMTMPRAYWLDRPWTEWPLSSVLMVIEPEPAETKYMWDRLQEWRLDADREVSKHYDDQLVNDRFGSSALVLPHRPYVLQTSVFRSEDSQRRAYMGTFNAPETDYEKWDPFEAVKEAKLIHFNDWPLPKPWIMWPSEGLHQIQPACGGKHEDTCDDREVWKGLYEDFRQRRKDLCKILSVPVRNIGSQHEEKAVR